MVKILILEDSYYMIDFLKERFDEKGWSYDIANNIASAQDFYENNQYDCFIIDLHVDPVGLTEDEFNSFEPYYGWAWFYNYVLLPNQRGENTLLRKKAIIYSKYSEEFKKSNYRYHIESIEIISKDDEKEDNKVIVYIEKIIKNKNSN